MAAKQAQIAGSRRALYGTLVAGGAASTLAGAGLLISDRDDQALRVAGGITAGFGAVNTLLGALALRGLAAEKPTRARDELLQGRQQEAVLFGVNLGLDVAYAVAGGAALLYARTSPAHQQRWQAAGGAVVAQAAFLFAVDLAGVVLATRAQRSLRP